MKVLRSTRVCLAIVVAVALTACAERPKSVLAPVADTVASTSRVHMLVATTRQRSADPGEMFTGERGLTPSFADITVSIPAEDKRTVGEVAWPKKLPPNPETDFATLKTEPLDRAGAVARLSSAVKATPDGSVLVFIHGFNNRFEDAVFRFAQIAHDSGTRSVPILVTWPSRGSVLAYGYDRESTNYTRDAVEDLFQFLALDAEVKEVSILAHSMGNWLAIEALRQMAIRNGRLPEKFRNIMLASPDVDVDVFRSQIADMGEQHPDFTLFVSRDDKALRASRRVWGDVSRLGAIDPEQAPYKEELAAREITVIDMTKVKTGDSLHHAKFASSPEIVRSIGARISDGQTLTDSRVSLGQQIVSATTGVAATVGGAAGAALAAPVAVIDPETRNSLVGSSTSSGGPAATPRCQVGSSAPDCPD